MVTRLPRAGATTVARIDLAALAGNFALLRRRARGRAIYAVVKADAYGHGAAAVAGRLAREGCDAFAVAGVEEVAALREAGIDRPVLVLGGVRDPADARAALALAAVPVLHDASEAAWLAAAARAAGRRAPVHVEVDTGMRRLGVPEAEAVAVMARVARDPHLRLEGVSTHFARADDPDPAPTRTQLAAFDAILAEVRRAGVDPGRLHVANSAALLAADGAGLAGDAVRPGLALYGVAPAPHLADPDLRPVMTVRSEVVAVRPVAAGEGVGYGHDFRAPRSGWVATLPIGYADGVPWSLARHGTVLIGGLRRPLAGRVSMDLTTVWLGEQPAPVGEEAIVFGVAGDGTRLGVEEQAEAAGTIAYELLVRVGARVPRAPVG